MGISLLYKILTISLFLKFVEIINFWENVANKSREGSWMDKSLCIIEDQDYNILGRRDGATIKGYADSQNVLVIKI